MPIKWFILVILVLASGFFIKTIRRIWVKELFKTFYAKRYSIKTGYRGMPLNRNGENTAPFVDFYVLLFTLLIAYIIIPHNYSKFAILMLCGVIWFSLNKALYKILKQHFENPKNITRYYPLYWHCHQFFAKHTRDKKPYIPQARCVWKKYDKGKIPYMYFDAIFWRFIGLAVIAPCAVRFIFYTPLNEHGKYHIFKQAIIFIKKWWNNLYSTLYELHFIIDISIIILIMWIYTWYICKILQSMISGRNKSNNAQNKVTDNPDNTTENVRIYIKTIPRKNQQISFYYTLKWSIPMIAELYILKLLNENIGNDWITLINVVYTCVSMYILYIALQYYVNEYSDVYIKVFSYKGQQSEFYKLTNNWRW